MSKLIRKWLTDERLRTEFGGKYSGEIADVTIERVNNKFKGAQLDEPIMKFTDGFLLIPNQKMRKDLVALLGKETDAWKGARIRIRRQAIQSTNKQTGEVKIRFVKVAEDAASERVAPATPWESEETFRDNDEAVDDRADVTTFSRRCAR